MGGGSATATSFTFASILEASWVAAISARPDSSEPSKPTAMDGDPVARVVAVAARRDADGARRAVKQGETDAAGEDLADAPMTRGADQDQVRPDLLGQLVQAARRRAARRGLGLGADRLRGRLDLARVLDLGVAEVRVEAAPDRVELEHAGRDKVGTGRVGELLAER